jgi:phosphatidylglycerol:prolipoprotein diacylglycerol transferase
MRQVLFQWHGVRVHSYPAMLLLGMIAAIVLGNYMANVAGMDSTRVFVAMVLLIVVGLIGSRLLFLITHWSHYRRYPGRIWRRSDGGAAMQGGLVLALVLSVPLLAAMRVPLGAFWDAATIGMLAWLVFARVGCTLHGCCGGRPSTAALALYLPDHRGLWCRRLPTQLFEGGWALLILAAAVAMRNHRPFSGALFLSAVAAYGVGRFAIEAMREARPQVGSINLQQILAAVLSLSSTIGLVVLSRSSVGYIAPSTSAAIDSFVWLTPLIMAPTALPFVFVGCADVLGIEDWERDPESEDKLIHRTVNLNIVDFETKCKDIIALKITFTWDGGGPVSKDVSVNSLVIPAIPIPLEMKSTVTELFCSVEVTTASGVVDAHDPVEPTKTEVRHQFVPGADPADYDLDCVSSKEFILS